VAVKQLIKTYYTQSFGLRNNKFKYTKDLISFINGLFPTKDLKFSVDLINKKKEQKDRMKTSTLHLLKTKTTKKEENEMLVNKLKSHFPMFDVDKFLQHKPTPIPPITSNQPYSLTLSPYCLCFLPP
jgi:hypothetical protein